MQTTSDGKKGGFLKGKPHSKGGIKAVVTDTNQPVELEGDEVILNKKSMSSEKVYSVKGTPKEIASAINSIDDNGVKFDEGATLTDEQTGETKTMEDGGELFGENIYEYLWFLKWHENDDFVEQKQVNEEIIEPIDEESV